MQAINATVIDGSYPAISFPKFLYSNALLHKLQVFFCKFLHQKATPCYAVQSDSAMQSNLRMPNFLNSYPFSLRNQL